MKFNTAGGTILSGAIKMTAANYDGRKSVGGLVLQIASQTTIDRVQNLCQSALAGIDDKSREYVFLFIDLINKQSKSKEFWQQSVNTMVKESGMFALDVWKHHAIEENPEEFRKFQFLLLDAAVLNFVMTVLGDARSKSFAQHAVGDTSSKPGCLGSVVAFTMIPLGGLIAWLLIQ